MKYVFCPTCGQKLNTRPLGDDGLVPWCDGCNRPWFDSFATCIIVALRNPQGEVLLQREARRPEREVLLAGYMQPGEVAEEAVLREIREETGLTATGLRYLGSYYHSGGDLLMLAFTAQADGPAATASTEVVAARWATPEEAISVLREGSIAQQVVMAIHTNTTT